MTYTPDMLAAHAIHTLADLAIAGIECAGQTNNEVAVAAADRFPGLDVVATAGWVDGQRAAKSAEVSTNGEPVALRYPDTGGRPIEAGDLVDVDGQRWVVLGREIVEGWWMVIVEALNDDVAIVASFRPSQTTAAS